MKKQDTTPTLRARRYDQLGLLKTHVVCDGMVFTYAGVYSTRDAWLAAIDKLGAQIFGNRYATLEKLKRE